MFRNLRKAGTGLAVLTTALMITGGPGRLPVLAAPAETAGDQQEKTVPDSTRTARVTVKNVDQAAAVTAYNVTKAVYNDYGFVRFDSIVKPASGTETAAPFIADLEKPDPQEVSSAAAWLRNAQEDALPEGTAKYAFTADEKDAGTWSADLPAGEYIIIVQSREGGTSIYNPMLAGVYYKDAGSADSLVTAGTIDAKTHFNDDDALYAKKVDIFLDKDIQKADGVNLDDQTDTGGNQGSQADDLQVGDTASFRITSMIPAYSRQAYAGTDVKYTLTDLQDPGFDAPTDIEIKVNGSLVSQGAGTVQVIGGSGDGQTFAAGSGNDFQIIFDKDFILAHTGESVEVSYKAALNGQAARRFDPNNDTVSLTYTNDIYGNTDVLDDTTQHFTFDAAVRKIGDGADSQAGLAGAGFTVRRVDEAVPADTGKYLQEDGSLGTAPYAFVTDKEGIASFTGLDEGRYEISEIQAPDGYSINEKKYFLTVQPVYKASADGKKGELEKYTLKLTDEEGTDVGSVVVEDPAGSVTAGSIADTRLQKLPSTGGYALYFGLAAAAGMGICFVVMRRQSKEE